MKYYPFFTTDLSVILMPTSCLPQLPEPYQYNPFYLSSKIAIPLDAHTYTHLEAAASRTADALHALGDAESIRRLNELADALSLVYDALIAHHGPYTRPDPLLPLPPRPTLPHCLAIANGTLASPQSSGILTNSRDAGNGSADSHHTTQSEQLTSANQPRKPPTPTYTSRYSPTKKQPKTSQQKTKKKPAKTSRDADLFG
jgi:hypothetical protein